MGRKKCPPTPRWLCSTCNLEENDMKMLVGIFFNAVYTYAQRCSKFPKKDGQGIIQNFQFKCIFLENVDVTIQFPLHNRRISPILFHEWIGPVDPGHMWGQAAQNIIITIWYWSLYFNVLICREMNYGQIKKPHVVPVKSK
jgi:hypothetical protein